MLGLGKRPQLHMETLKPRILWTTTPILSPTSLPVYADHMILRKLFEFQSPGSLFPWHVEPYTTRKRLRAKLQSLSPKIRPWLACNCSPSVLRGVHLLRCVDPHRLLPTQAQIKNLVNTVSFTRPVVDAINPLGLDPTTPMTLSTRLAL